MSAFVELTLPVSVCGYALNVTAQERICIAAPYPNKKSCFVKRSAVICEPSQNDFRFNFDVTLDTERSITNRPTTSHNSFVYKSSDNSFRFNFVQPASWSQVCHILNSNSGFWVNKHMF